MKHIDYRICYNYLFSNFYFGASGFGLIDAAGFYYKKDYKDLRDKEFISLCLFLTNPTYYNILDESKANRRNKKIEEIYSKLER